MLLGTILPALAALAAGVLAWRYETQRLEWRSLYEPRGLDVPEEEFRRWVVDRRKRRRVGITVLSALAGSVVATALLYLVQLSALTRGG
jgi:hypothetical protein